MPKTLAALPLCIAMPIDWKRKLVDLLSPMSHASLDPISLINLMAIGAQDPMVSAAIGITMKPDADKFS